MFANPKCGKTLFVGQFDLLDPSRSGLSAPPPEIAATLSVLGGKWKILERTARFNELRRAIPGITQHMLTSHLHELESEHVVSRTIFAEVPPRVEYRLTEHGATLGNVLKVMAELGRSHLAAVEAEQPAAK
jgi:DNA-binding HxlR family transcriptional regulator